MSFFEDCPAVLPVASYPPRRKSQASLTSWADKSTLEILQLMGFTKQRAEKAIAATGSNGVQEASDWLLSHVNDPNLDVTEPREYIIYLCPKGSLQEQLQQFWEDSLRQCGWNSAHIYHPHITLCSFFPMCDGKVDILDPLMELLLLELNQWPRVGPLKLDLYTKNKNFIGYFVKSPHDAYVESLMVRLQQEFLKAGVDMKPQQKQLHLTLAFQYAAEHHETLLRLAERIDLDLPTHWEIQIYSRDPAIKNAEVRRVLKNYKPQQADELELNTEDFVFMDPEEHTTSPDGWFKGTSWRSGLSAFFPGNFTSKCAQMEIWTLHRFATLPNFFARGDSAETNLTTMEVDTPELVVALPQESQSGAHEYDNVWDGSGVSQLYSAVNKPGRKEVQREVQRPPRKLIISRHGERCDFAFYKEWFTKSFDEEGHYSRFNLNCPKFLVSRASFRDFSKDAPLTLIGRHQARLTGEALLEEGQTVTSVYCSPSLRCVETATEILKGLRSPCRLRIEPCLYEWSGWTRPDMPHFMSPMELEANGFPVDKQYTPFLTADEISISESVADYYNRSYNFTKIIMRKHKAEGGTTLFVGHSGTLDACTRQMLGHPPRDVTSFQDTIRGCPYCALCCMHEDSGIEEMAGTVKKIRGKLGEEGRWWLIDPPVLPLSHGANKDATWKTILS